MPSLVCSVCTWWCLSLRLSLISWYMLWAKLVLQHVNLIKNCWNMKICSPLRLSTSMCRICWDPCCYHLYARLLCLLLWVIHLLGQLRDPCAKIWKSSYVMRKDRDGSVLSHAKVSGWLPIAHLDELEPCSECWNHCLKLLVVYDIGLAWLLS
jgi:hypothetical protein